MNNRQYDLVVFDWDGTVVDSTNLIAESIQATAQDLALPIPSDRDARYIIGLGLLDALRHLFPGLEEARYSEVSARYSYHFLAGNHRVQPFEGARQLLEDLNAAGYVVAIATGKSRRGLDRSLEQSGLARFFHATRCADEGFPKPHPEMLHFLMDSVAAPASRTIMIGDTTHDVGMAHNAGTRAVAVSYGAHGKAELLASTPLACVDSVAELTAWLSRHG